jgi:hypothetical protein
VIMDKIENYKERKVEYISFHPYIKINKVSAGNCTLLTAYVKSA